MVLKAYRLDNGFVTKGMKFRCLPDLVARINYLYEIKASPIVIDADQSINKFWEDIPFEQEEKS